MDKKTPALEDTGASIAAVLKGFLDTLLKLYTKSSVSPTLPLNYPSQMRRSAHVTKQ